MTLQYNCSIAIASIIAFLMVMFSSFVFTSQTYLAPLFLSVAFLTLPESKKWLASTLTLSLSFLILFLFSKSSLQNLILLSSYFIKAAIMVFFFKSYVFKRIFIKKEYELRCKNNPFDGVIIYVCLPLLILDLSLYQFLPIYSLQNAYFIWLYMWHIFPILLAIPLLTLAAQEAHWNILNYFNALSIFCLAALLCCVGLCVFRFPEFSSMILPLACVIITHYKGIKFISIFSFVLGMSLSVYFSLWAINDESLLNTAFIYLGGALSLGIFIALMVVKRSNKTHSFEPDNDTTVPVKSIDNFFSNNDEIIIVLSTQGNIVSMSSGACDFFEQTFDTLFNSPIKPYLSEDSYAQLSTFLDASPPRYQRLLLEFVHKLGVSGYLECTIQYTITQYDQQRAVCYFINNGEAKLNEFTNLKDEKERLEATLSSIGDAVICTDINSNITYMNPVAEAVLALLTEEVKGQPFSQVVNLYNESTSTPIRDLTNFSMKNKEKLGLPESTCLKNHLGLTFAIQDSISPIYSKKGKVIGAISVFQDATESRSISRRMTHLAHHDSITGLPNKLLFQDRVSQACKRAKENKTLFAIAYIELDCFEKIKASLGDISNDVILKRMSERFSSNISSLDTVCRIEGNEFLILFDGIQRKKFVKTVVDNFLKYSTVDFELNTHKLKVYLSAGVAIYPDDGLSLDSLIQHAGKALYEAKKIDTTSFHFYNTQLEAKHKFKAELKEDVINGILNNEFCVYYQPIINAKSHEIESLEVHVYWQKKQQLIDTNKYFSIAKETNLMSIWVNAITEEALKHFKVWLVHNPNLMLSFNLTQILLCDEKFASKLLDLLEIHQIPAKNIEVLISEPTLVAEREYFKELLNVLHRFGFRIVLDSFGTANTSFCYLQEVYFDGFIIPPKYTHELTGQLDMNETAIVVVNLAKGMNVNCTAKGIENVIQAKVLSLNGCKQLQGDYFSKPLPFEKVSSQLLKGCSLNK